MVNSTSLLCCCFYKNSFFDDDDDDDDGGDVDKINCLCQRNAKDRRTVNTEVGERMGRSYFSLQGKYSKDMATPS